jgi:hypothetical protein
MIPSKEQLVEKREMLREWQGRRWFGPGNEGRVRLHLGSGKFRIPNAVNVDLTPEADVQADIRTYPYEAESVDDIICHHVLEHLPMMDVPPLLAKWAAALRPGGTVEIGVPDMDLMCHYWTQTDEDEKWRWDIWPFYGGQSDEPCTYPWVERPYNPYMTHQSGFTLGYLVRLLEGLGLRMVDAFWYDGHDTPSAFVLAIKPHPTEPTVLEEQAIMGTFTHRCEYVPGLWQSAARHVPGVPFRTRIQHQPINKGMELLRRDFLTSGRRYWIFLDDDIQFLAPGIVDRAIRHLIAGGYSAMSVYSMFEPDCLAEEYSPARYGLTAARETQWATGYFVLVDSQRVGHILPDLHLPDGNTSVDTSYSVAMRAEGHKIGLSPDYVYHTLKPGSWVNPAVIGPTNEYLRKRWGQFYFDVAKYDHNIIGWEAVDQ